MDELSWATTEHTDWCRAGRLVDHRVSGVLRASISSRSRLAHDPVDIDWRWLRLCAWSCCEPYVTAGRLHETDSAAFRRTQEESRKVSSAVRCWHGAACEKESGPARRPPAAAARPCDGWHAIQHCVLRVLHHELRNRKRPGITSRKPSTSRHIHIMRHRDSGFVLRRLYRRENKVYIISRLQSAERRPRGCVRE